MLLHLEHVKNTTTVGPKQATLHSAGFIQPPSKKCRSDISVVKKCVLTLACSRHILPLQFFEDPVIHQGFGVPFIARQDVTNHVRQMAVEIKHDLMEKHRGEWATLALG
jgi:hypothetical protein